MYYYVELIQSTTIKVVIKVDNINKLHKAICKVADEYFYGKHRLYCCIDDGIILTNNIVCLYKRVDSFHSFSAEKE